MARRRAAIILFQICLAVTVDAGAILFLFLFRPESVLPSRPQPAGVWHGRATGRSSPTREAPFSAINLAYFSPLARLDAIPPPAIVAAAYGLPRAVLISWQLALIGRVHPVFGHTPRAALSCLGEAGQGLYC